MDDKTKEQYIRQIINLTQVTDKEVSLLAGNDETRRIKIYRMLNYTTSLFRMQEMPLDDPDYCDVLRLIANIADLTREQSKKFKKDSSDG